MKTRIQVLTVAFISLSILAVDAQPGMGGMGGPAPGPSFSGPMAKFFGNNSTFTASVEIQANSPQGEKMSMPGKMAFDGGKARFEMDLTEAKGGQMPPEAAAHMKSMGMDKTVRISRPDRKLEYLVYPGIQAYVEEPAQDSGAALDNAKVETTELGKETFDGHPCVKNKAVVTDNKGNKHEATIWNATDLKDFPLKIETQERGQAVTMLFKDVKFGKPDAGQFEPPSDFKKYNSQMDLIRQEMMKRMGGGMGMPGGQ